MTETKPVEREASEVPSDIRRATAALASDRSYAIVVYLLKKTGAPFAKLEEELDIHQQTLSNTLEKLQNGGIVVRKEYVEEGSRYRTRYEVSEFGKRLLDHLFESRNPRPQNEPEILPLYDGSESDYNFSHVQTENEEEVTSTKLKDAVEIGTNHPGQFEFSED